MKLFNRDTILTILNGYLVDSPTTSSISYLWNIGSMLGVVLIFQIISGLVLAFHYVPNIELAFDSIERIHRDIWYGAVIRYMHSNGAALFFILVYIHIGKALYYGSYHSPRTAMWNVGVVIFILMMATAFLGKFNSPTCGIVYFTVTVLVVYLVDYLYLFINSIVLMSDDLNPSQRKVASNEGGLELEGEDPVEGGVELEGEDPEEGGVELEGEDPEDRFQQWCRKKGLVGDLAPVKVLYHLNGKLELDEIKLSFKGTEEWAGAYAVVNLKDGRCYVGRTTTGHLVNRYKNHLYYLVSGKTNKRLKHAVQVYGVSSFVFVILEKTDTFVNQKNQHIVNQMERKFELLIHPEYNVVPTGNVGYTKMYDNAQAQAQVHQQAQAQAQVHQQAQAQAASVFEAELDAASVWEAEAALDEEATEAAFKAIDEALAAYPAPVMKASNHYRRPVLLLDKGTMEVVAEFASVSDTAAHLKLSPSSVSIAAKNNGVIGDLYKVKYKYPR